MIDQYTRLLEMVAETGDEKAADEAVHKLVAHLKSSGRMKMLPQIMGELKRVAGRRRLLAPRLEVASQEGKAQAVKEAKAEGIEAKEVRVNPSLVSGWRGIVGGTLVDRSGKRALIDIYQKVTT